MNKQTKIVEIMESLTLQTIVEFAKKNGKRFEAYSPFMDRWNDRVYESTRVGVELKPHVWFWFQVWENDNVMFEHRYNQANGKVMKSFNQGWKAKQIILGN